MTLARVWCSTSEQGDGRPISGTAANLAPKRDASCTWAPSLLLSLPPCMSHLGLYLGTYLRMMNI